MNKLMPCIIAVLATIMVATASPGLQPLTIGTQIPDLSLKDANGESVNLQSMAKAQPLVLIFYRGGWCPYCNVHLGQLQEIDPQLRAMGYRIVAVSPDRPEELAKSAEKEGLNYILLSDSKMAAAKAFGLAFTVDGPTLAKYTEYGIDLETASGEKHHMLPVPAVFLIGTDGVIDFVYANPDYKTRIDPEVLLTQAKANQI